jgi:hypothetical protein
MPLIKFEFLHQYLVLILLDINKHFLIQKLIRYVLSWNLLMVEIFKYIMLYLEINLKKKKKSIMGTLTVNLENGERSTIGTFGTT